MVVELQNDKQSILLDHRESVALKELFAALGSKNQSEEATKELSALKKELAVLKDESSAKISELEHQLLVEKQTGLQGQVNKDASIQKLEKEVRDLKSEAREAKRTHRKEKEALEKTISKATEGKKDAVDATPKESELKEKLNKAEKEATAVGEKLANSRRETVAFQEQLTVSEKALKESQVKLQQALDQSKLVNGFLQISDIKAAEASKKASALQAEVESLGLKVRDLEKDLKIANEKALSSARALPEAVRNEYERQLRKEREERADYVLEVEKRIESLKAEILQKNIRITYLEEQLAAKTDALSKAQAEGSKVDKTPVSTPVKPVRLSIDLR